MSKIRAEVEGGCFYLVERDENTNQVLVSNGVEHRREIVLYHYAEAGGDNLVCVGIATPDGNIVATPFRLKMSNSGARIAADFPSCDEGFVIVDENGRITNG